VTLRELNRATLSRQLLLERADLDAVAAIEHLAGLQAQESTGPYLSLWARLRDFDKEELTTAIEERRVQIATLHRVTLHMLSARDHRWVWPTLQPMLARAFRRGDHAELDHDALLAEIRTLLPARMPELRKLHPVTTNPGLFAMFVQGNLPLVRRPPAGTWRVSGSPVQELAEVGEPDDERLVTAYLAAFGPASPRDMQTWSGLTRLAPVFKALDLEELDRGLYDLPDAPRPPADTPAPVRFLPRWDNYLLGHHDRRRDLPEGRKITDAMGRNTVLVDGVVAGTWVHTGDDVEVTPWRRLPREVDEERIRLRDWLRA
jgi:hypothetical protein